MNRCPHCGHSLDVEQVTIDTLRARCADKGHRVLDGDLVSEAAAAQLLGYAGADTLRKQATEHGGRVPYLMRGNRRLYSLKDLLAHVPA